MGGLSNRSECVEGAHLGGFERQKPKYNFRGLLNKTHPKFQTKGTVNREPNSRLEKCGGIGSMFTQDATRITRLSSMARVYSQKKVLPVGQTWDCERGGPSMLLFGNG